MASGHRSRLHCADLGRLSPHGCNVTDEFAEPFVPQDGPEAAHGPGVDVWWVSRAVFGSSCSPSLEHNHPPRRSEGAGVFQRGEWQEGQMPGAWSQATGNGVMNPTLHSPKVAS